MMVNGIHFQEYAKLEYGRLLWRVPEYRERLLRHWRDPRHPHAERFGEHEGEVRHILESAKNSDAALDAELRQRNLSRNHAMETQCLLGLFAQGHRREALPDP